MPSVVPFVLGETTAPGSSDQSLMHRPHLWRRLDELTDHKICLLLAPTGSGKTTLLSQYYQRHITNQSIAWLRLDEFDVDHVRFFRKLSAAVRLVQPGFDGFTALQHHASSDLRADLALSACVAGFAHLQQPLYIIIDNFEYLEECNWRTLIQQLLELSPKPVHWILAGRNASGIDITRWEQNESIGLLNQNQLFFTAAETEQFLKNQTRHTLPDEALQRVFQYTRGWPAGVKLAQVYLSCLDEKKTPVLEHFGRHIFVGLSNALLSVLPNSLHHFLINTAFLEHFNPALCNYVLQRMHCETLIQQLQGLTLFIETEVHTSTIRYHPLFREHLLSIFQQQPAAVRDRLIARACTWLVDNGERETACRLARQHSQNSFLVEMLRQSFREWFRMGHAEPVFYWAQQLGESTLLALPETRYAWCWALTMFGQMVAAESILSQSLLQTGARGSDWRSLYLVANDNQDIAAAVLHSIIQLFRGKLTDEHVELLNRLYNTTIISPDLRASIDNIFSQHAIHQCHFREARQRANQAIFVLKQTRNLFGQSLGQYLVANSYYQSNDIKNALLTCDTYLESMPDKLGCGSQALIAGFRAYLLYQSGQPLGAETIVTDLLFHSQPGYSIDLQLYLYIPLIRLKTRRGEYLETHYMLEQLQLSASASGSRIFIAHSAYEHFRLAYAKGNTREFQHWLDYFKLEDHLAQALDPATLMQWDEREHWMLSGILRLMQRGQYDGARALAQQLLYLNVDHGYPIRFLPINLCIAFLDYRTGQISTAFRRLNDTLTQADATGILTGLIDDLPGMDEFVRVALQQGRLHNPEHIAKMVSLGVLELQPAPVASPLETLTTVERNIVKAVQLGSSPGKISAELLLSQETLSWHLRNIAYKLDLDEIEIRTMPFKLD